jgi:hypothetical protein
MNSILVIIYLLIFQPCDTVLYISLAIISVVSIFIIVQQSRPIEPVDHENSTLLVRLQHEPGSPRTIPQQSYHTPQNKVFHESQPAILESEAESEHYQEETHPCPSQSSRTSMGVHDTSPPNMHPPQAVAPVHQQDTLLQTGSLFADDNDNSNLPPPQPRRFEFDSDGSTSSLDLNG